MDKVYFDYNIYSHLLEKDNEYYKLVKDEMSKLYKFYYSGAIAEETYKRICNDVSRRHEGEISKNIEFISNLTENKKIIPTTSIGLISSTEKFEECYKRVKSDDTRDIIEDIGKETFKKNNMFQEDFNIIDLSKKSKEEVWEDPNIKETLKELSYKYYKDSSYDKTIKNSYKKLKNNYGGLEMWIEILLKLLDMYKYNNDDNERTSVSGIHDTSHLIYGTYCDMFVSNDFKLRKKGEAIYYFLDIPTKTLSLRNFVSSYKKN